MALPIREVLPTSTNLDRRDSPRAGYDPTLKQASTSSTSIYGSRGRDTFTPSVYEGNPRLYNSFGRIVELRN